MINQQTKNMERTIILDACALKSQEAMEIIENAEKVIVLTGTIKELDKNKENDSQYGKNIRYIGKKIRQDTESKKYICISKYEKYKYNDDNIIDYCIWHNNATILTSDNYLCAKAKAHGIPYIFPKISKPHKKNQEEKSTKCRCNIKGVTWKNDKLLILRQNLLDPSFNVIIVRYGKVIKFSLERNIQLNVEDNIIRVKESNNDVTVTVFEIVSIESKNYAEHIETISLKKPIIESLKNLNWPVEVKKQICFLLDTENYDEEKQEGVYIKNRIVYSNKQLGKSYICLERNGNFIVKQECREGDIVYLAKKNKKSITLYVYRIVKKLNIYSVDKIDTYSIKSINEIYSINCSDKVKDKMREFYIHNFR